MVICMIVGESRVTNMFLNMLNNSTRIIVDEYINSVCSRNFMVLCSMEQVDNVFGGTVNDFLSSLSSDDLLNLRSYTGYNFRNINAILRGNWNYEVNGHLDHNKSYEFRILASNISSIIDKFRIPNIDFTVFRGTTLDSFNAYGINKISDLRSLCGKFLYEQGFTSTSILRDTSYVNKKLDDGRYCNVEIRYLIPSESNDGALLCDNNISYSTNQNEFLINSGSLTKIIKVLVDENTNTAILFGVLVPKKIYDIEYFKKINDSRSM